MAKDDAHTGMMQVELGQDEVEKRSAKLASEELAREELLEKKRSHNRLWNEELKQARERINQLSTEVHTGKAWVPAQSDLFDAETGEAFDEDPESPTEVPPPAKRRGRGRRTAEPADFGGEAA